MPQTLRGLLQMHRALAACRLIVELYEAVEEGDELRLEDIEEAVEWARAALDEEDE